MAKAPNKKGAAAPATATPATEAKSATPAKQKVEKQAAPALPWVGVQHGVTPPKRAGLCSAVWQLTTDMWPGRAEGAAPPALAAVKAAAAEKGLNPTNVAIEYYRARQWHGVRGRGTVAAAQQ